MTKNTLKIALSTIALGLMASMACTTKVSAVLDFPPSQQQVGGSSPSGHANNLIS